MAVILHIQITAWSFFVRLRSTNSYSTQSAISELEIDNSETFPSLKNL